MIFKLTPLLFRSDSLEYQLDKHRSCVQRMVLQIHKIFKGDGMMEVLYKT